MNLLVISQLYPPDLGAASFRMEAIVNKMINNGHNVFIITATPNRYSNFKVKIKNKEGENITRVKLKYSSKNILSRVIGFFEFFYKVNKLKKSYQKYSIDLVISTTPYLLEGLVGQIFAKYLKAKHLLDVRDLWPDTPIALGKIYKFGLLAYILKKIEKKLYLNSDFIVVTSPGYLSRIRKVTNNNNQAVVLNGIDDDFESLVPKSNEFALEKKDKKRILYAGNIGVSQNLITLIKAGSMLNPESYEFTLIGSGTQLLKIKKLIKKLKLPNFKILPPVSRNKLVEYYLNHDILYLQLNSNEYFHSVIPSKIFEYLLFNKPIIYGLKGIAKDLLSSYEGTYFVEPDNPSSLVDILRKNDFSEKIQRNCNHLRRNKQIDIYSKILEKLVSDFE